MSAFSFDPWAGLKREGGDAAPAKPANRANRKGIRGEGLAELASLAEVAPPTFNTASTPAAPTVGTGGASVPVTADAETPAPQALPPRRQCATDVDSLAVALLAKAEATPGVHIIGNREGAMAYFRGMARNRLAATR